MNRTDFGKLVAALRHELGLKQSELAEAGRVDIAVLSQIERGTKKTLDANLLVKLAEALRLTALERKEFLIAADGLETEQIVRPPSAGLDTDTFSSERVLEKMIGLMESLNLPAFLLDVYSDALAANLIASAFFQVSPKLMEDAGEIPGGTNIIRIVFGKDSSLQDHFRGDWETYARNTMLAFRMQSLRYRAQPYFKYLMKIFRNSDEYPLFNEYWKLTSAYETQAAELFHVFDYEHENFGRLAYMTSPIQSTTRHGELILIQYLPMNENTSALFDRFVAEYGQHAVRLGSWPEKSMPRAIGSDPVEEM